MSSISLNITTGEHNALHKYLSKANFTIQNHPYHTNFRNTQYTINLYQRKLVLQGNNNQECLTYVIEPILMQYNNTYKQYHIITALDQYQYQIGADESGKGDVFFPLIVCAVFTDDKKVIDMLIKAGVRDSKLIVSHTKIKELARLIKKNTYFQINILAPSQYNKTYQKFMNLNLLLGWLYSATITNLLDKISRDNVTIKTPISVLIDQFCRHPKISSKSTTKYTIKLNYLTKAEKYTIVAAASILARDSLLTSQQQLNNTYKMNIPLGAGKLVDQAIVTFSQLCGASQLTKVAKMHFRNIKNYLNKSL